MSRTAQSGEATQIRFPAPQERQPVRPPGGGVGAELCPIVVLDQAQPTFIKAGHPGQGGQQIQANAPPRIVR